MQNTLILNLPVSLVHYLSLKRILNLKTFWILSVLSIISLLGFYIFQANRVISEGYLVQECQKESVRLTRGNKILEINSIQVNSLVNIQSKIRELGFEKANKINYIQVMEAQIVRE